MANPLVKQSPYAPRIEYLPKYIYQNFQYQDLGFMVL